MTGESREYGLRIARVAAAAVAALSAATGIGNLTSVSFLTRVLEGRPATAPLSSLILLLAAVSLWLLTTSDTRAQTSSRFAAAIVALGAALSQVSPTFALGAETAAVAPLTTTLLVLVGLVLIAPDHPRLQLTHDLGTVILALVALFAVATSLFSSVAPAPPAPDSRVPLPIAVGAGLVAAGSLAARPNSWLGALLRSSGVEGLLVRRLSVVIAIVPLLIGWLRLEAERAHLFNLEIGLAVMVTAAVAILTVVAFSCAAIVRRVDRERREVERKLVAADRLSSLGVVAAGIAHEVNNPLSFVIGNIDVALADLKALDPKVPTTPQSSDPAPNPAEIVRMLEESRDGACLIRTIVQDLRLFARANDDSPRSFDVRATLRSALRICSMNLQARARLVEDLREVPLVNGKEARLGQVFLNLLVNAIQAIPAGARDQNEIRVATGVDARGRVNIVIQDSGGGIPADVEAHLFEPFFTTKPPGIGSGLGLAISRDIVSAHGGEIRWESQPGNGTKFTVVLPAVENLLRRPEAVAG
ncbi:MAG: hypothetical protein HYY84_15985 [Deltaproteobacteria bacterium]|nr:hypothetical protein [Deltaproteobacteria bacterium]